MVESAQAQLAVAEEAAAEPSSPEASSALQAQLATAQAQLEAATRAAERAAEKLEGVNDWRGGVQAQLADIQAEIRKIAERRRSPTPAPASAAATPQWSHTMQAQMSDILTHLAAMREQKLLRSASGKRRASSTSSPPPLMLPKVLQPHFGGYGDSPCPPLSLPSSAAAGAATVQGGGESQQLSGRTGALAADLDTLDGELCTSQVDLQAMKAGIQQVSGKSAPAKLFLDACFRDQYLLLATSSAGVTAN